MATSLGCSAALIPTRHCLSSLSFVQPLSQAHRPAFMPSRTPPTDRKLHVYAGKSGQGFGKKDFDDEIRTQRQIAIAATDLLAKLLQAEDKVKEIAIEYVESLNEEFFHIGSAYLQMAKKEGDEAVAGRLEAALKAAMEVKNSTLRPEIQLLNKLLGADTELQRKQILNSSDAGTILSMNDFYFFGLLDRMTKDVSRQPDGPQKKDLQAKLVALRQDAVDRLPQDVREKVPVLQT